MSSTKKRTAPPPPGTNIYGTLPNSHSRTPSDPVVPNNHGYHTLNHPNHKRSPSSDSGVASTGRMNLTTSVNLLGAKLVIPPGDKASMKPSSVCDKSGSGCSSIQRPRGPPPPTPSPVTSVRLSNGRSTESISSIVSEAEQIRCFHNPVPPPRKTQPLPCLAKLSATGLRRCRALYDCDADNPDELSFREGEVIIVTNEQTEDENWKDGYVEGDPSRHGMFPISFVHMLAD